jgi:hypothetical protein
MSKRKPASKKVIPAFTSEDQERKFWAEHDTTEYLDWSKTSNARRNVPARRDSYPNAGPRKSRLGRVAALNHANGL